MKYAAELASGAMIEIPSFMKIGSGIQVILRLLPHSGFSSSSKNKMEY
jgi:hypothetical protein